MDIDPLEDTVLTIKHPKLENSKAEYGGITPKAAEDIGISKKVLKQELWILTELALPVMVAQSAFIVRLFFFLNEI